MPLWNRTPLLRWKVQFLPSCSQLSASMGTGFKLSSRSTTDSYISWLMLMRLHSVQVAGFMEAPGEAT